MVLALLVNFYSKAATYTVTGVQNWSAFGTTPTAADNIIVRGGGNLTVDVANAVCNNMTIGVVFSGTGTLTFNAGSQLTSSGNFIIALFNNGTLNMTAGGTLIADNIVDGGGTGTFICGIGIVKLSGTQTLPDFMTPFYNLQTTVGTTTLSTNTVVSNSLTVDKNTTLNLSNRTLGAPTSLTLETLGGGTGSTISGTGLLTLGSNVTVNYTGAGAITTGATISCPVALSADRIFTVNDDGSTAGSDLTISGIISTAFGLTKAGAGELTLSGANTFTGGVTLNAGTLNINNTQALGTIAGTFTIAAGTTINNTSAGAITTLNYVQAWNGDFTFTGTQDLNIGTGTVTMSASRQITTTTAARTLTVGGIINNNTQNLTKSGAGILAFVNQAITLNTLTINAGALSSTSGTLSLTGNFSNSATYTHNNGTVSLDGTATQTIGGTTATTFYNVIFNNDPGISGDVTLATNNYVVNNQITMTRGNIDLNGRTLMLGTAVGSPGTLSYSNGYFYGSAGTFTRWISATSAAMGAIAANALGHFPMGTSTGNYRPLWIAYSSDLTTGGTVSMRHDPTTLTTAASHNDASWGTGTIVQAVTNSNWIVSTANGFSLNGATGRIRFGGEGYGTNTLADLNATLLASTVGTFATATAANTVIEVNRTGLTTANLTNTWRIGTRDLGSSPLPIELISFDATANADNIDITWETATEINNDFFTVERSTDAVTFESIGIVDGAGNSTSILNYSLVDYNPYKATSYYRLKQTDFDGQFTYSKAVAVEFADPTDGFSFNVFPNPSNGEDIQLSFTSSKDEEEVSVVIYDTNGKKYYSKVIIIQTNSDGVYALNPFHKLAAGMYLITATSNQAIYGKKLIVK